MKRASISLGILTLTITLVVLAFVVSLLTATTSLAEPTATKTPPAIDLRNVTVPTLMPTATPIVVSPTPPLPTIRPNSYSVVAGDTVLEIAKRFSVPFGYLADQNNLANPDLIYVDQVLKIPEWPPKTDGKEIYVVLSEQKVYALEDGKTIKELVVSTGTTRYPTVTGRYEIYIKYLSAKMSGGEGAEYYYLPNVPYIMYFYNDYGLHGTYWHNNFGTPMSHGCVNLRVEDAEWLFDWASVGTPVVIVP